MIGLSIAQTQSLMRPVATPSVLFVGAYPKPAVLERYVSGDLALRLQSRGWPVHVTSRCPGRLARVGEILWDTWAARRGYTVACVDVFSGPAFFWAEMACFVSGSR